MTISHKVYTGEVGAKRLRERYLQAVLRQDIAFFDNIGAGAVATHIQTDTRGFLHSVLLRTIDLINFCRSCPTGHLREIGDVLQLLERILHWFHFGIYPVLATCSSDVLDLALYRHNGIAHEQSQVQVHAYISPVYIR